MCHVEICLVQGYKSSSLPFQQTKWNVSWSLGRVFFLVGPHFSSTGLGGLVPLHLKAGSPSLWGLQTETLEVVEVGCVEGPERMERCLQQETPNGQSFQKCVLPMFPAET